MIRLDIVLAYDRDVFGMIDSCVDCMEKPGALQEYMHT